MPRAQPITVDQFLGLIQDGEKADLLDGMIYMASPDSPEAARRNGFLYGLLDFYVAERELGELYGPRSAFRLSNTYAPEPDIAFVERDRLHLWERAIFHGAPDLAVEIVSTESIDRDRRLKRDVYERAGVREYWMVDLLDGRCTFLRLYEGKYRDVTPGPGEVFHSEVIHGFWLDPEWLFAEKLPRPRACLERILASGG